MNFLRKLFRTQLDIYSDKASLLIKNADYTGLRVLYLDLEEYIYHNEFRWKDSKIAKYNSLLEEIGEIL